MLRAHHVDEGRASEVARRFGFSRQTFYLSDAAFRAARWRGLLPERPGPKGPHKVAPELARYLRTQHKAHPEMGYQALAEAAATKFGIRLHPRTVRRALAPCLFPPPRVSRRGKRR
jgi:transposase